MKVSRSWLQTYFDKPLPAAGKMAELFTFGAFEVESVEPAGNDDIFDLKVLPDRACYALSHRGIAYELSAIADIKKKPQVPVDVDPTIGDEVSVKIEDKTLCRRYCARLIEGVKIKKSPEWLVSRLESVGQRAINNIVDATNFVMLDMGQPLHAFDADKVKGGIIVRAAKNGEEIELLPERVITPDGKTEERKRVISLSDKDIVIADDGGPIALAGTKGGLRAAVTDKTKNIIMESANFNPVSVRRTSTKYALRNDASKRFENALSPEYAKWAMEEVTAVIRDTCGASEIGPVTDKYPSPVEIPTVFVQPDFVTESLGVSVDEKEMQNIFDRLEIGCTKTGENFSLTPPFFRLDISIPEDIVEEVGRIYGYGKIPAKLPPSPKNIPQINSVYYWIEKTKAALIDFGFSEVFTYALAENGEVEIINPLALDKKFLRANLADGVLKSLEMNARNADLFNTDRAVTKEIKIFEIGNVFNKKGDTDEEHLNLCISVKKIKLAKGETAKRVVDEASEAVLKVFGFDLASAADFKVAEKELDKASAYIEWDLGAIMSGKTKQNPEAWNVEVYKVGSVSYAPISLYPFAVRDIAVFVPIEETEENVRKIIQEKAGKLLIRLSLFDVFTKKFPDGTEKTSYAFRLVFQSHEKTLDESDINSIMENVTAALNGKPGWQVR